MKKIINNIISNPLLTILIIWGIVIVVFTLMNPTAYKIAFIPIYIVVCIICSFSFNKAMIIIEKEVKEEEPEIITEFKQRIREKYIPELELLIIREIQFLLDHPHEYNTSTGFTSRVYIKEWEDSLEHYKNYLKN